MTEAEQMGSLCERYPVGPETDALVEVHIFGQDMAAECDGELSDMGDAQWECSECGARGRWGDDYPDPHPRVPRRFTREERLARLVMEAMEERGCWWLEVGLASASYLRPIDREVRLPETTVRTWRAKGESSGGATVETFAPTMPHAVVLAALLALGVIQ